MDNPVLQRLLVYEKIVYVLLLLLAFYGVYKVGYRQGYIGALEYIANAMQQTEAKPNA